VGSRGRKHQVAALSLGFFDHFLPTVLVAQAKQVRRELLAREAGLGRHGRVTEPTVPPPPPMRLPPPPTQVPPIPSLLPPFQLGPTVDLIDDVGSDDDYDVLTLLTPIPTYTPAPRRPMPPHSVSRTFMTLNEEYFCDRENYHPVPRVARVLRTGRPVLATRTRARSSHAEFLETPAAKKIFGCLPRPYVFPT
jgi:hypothetical protein